MKIKHLSYKIIAIILASIMLLLTINFNVFALTQNAKGTIEITGIENVEGIKVTAYKIAEAVYDDDANQPKEPVIKWTDSVKTYLQSESEYSTYIDARVFSNALKEDTESIKKFYDKLASKIKSGNIQLGEINIDTSSIENGTLTTQELEMGTYLILVEGGNKIYQAAIANIAPKYDDTSKEWKINSDSIKLDIKSSEPKIEKKVTNKTATGDDKLTFKTGDTIDYEIITDIPTYLENNISKKYYISDKLSQGLTFVENSLKVFGIKENEDETTLLTKDTAYTEEASKQRPNTEEKSTFVLNFVYDQIKDYKKIKVTYSAILNDDKTTTIGNDGNGNKAVLDYSNNPYTDSSSKTKESEVKVYTYRAIVKKQDKTTKTPLSGAQFEVYKATEDGREADVENGKLKFKSSEDGVYYVSKDMDATETITVDASGNLQINGLENGTYYLREIKAPDGYVKLSEDEKFEIKNANNESITVENSNGFVLPLTGGIGTTIFVAVGSVVMGLGVLLIIFILRRKNNNNPK